MKRIPELNMVAYKWDFLLLSTDGKLASKSNSFHPLDPRCYVDLLRRGEKTLISSEIWPTSRCNHYCTFCSSDRYGFKGTTDLNWDVMERLVNDIADMGNMVVRFSGGGEPTLYDKLGETIKLVAKRDMLGCLITNGTGLSEGLVSLATGNLALLRFSFNGGDRESYRKVHRYDGFDEVVRVMSLAAEERRKNGRDNELLLGATFIITKDNFRVISKAAKVVKESGLDYILLRGHNPTKQLFQGEERKILEREIEASHKLKDANFVVNGKPNSLDGTKPIKPLLPRCYVTHFRAYINSKGEVFPCFNAICIGQNPCGSIVQRSISDVWGKNEHLRVRERLEKGQNFGYCTNSKFHCGYGDFNKNMWELEQVINRNPRVCFKKQASVWAEDFMPEEEWF